jgi:hypothetical protein
VNDITWRNLSAILGAACLVLIVAAGALLMTGGTGSASPTLSPPVGGESASASLSTDTVPTPIVIGPSGSPTVMPSITPVPKAPIASITFNNLLLDASTDTLGHPRTFTFITDGVGPVGISITKSSPAKTTTRICASLDGSKPTCYTGTKVTFKGAYTDTAHSVWVVTLVGNQNATPTVDIAFSWPTNNASITLTHGRFQGSSSPGVSENLNGFMATFAARANGNFGLSAVWTQITTDAMVTTNQVVGGSTSLLDQKSYTSVQNLGTPGYSYAVQAGKTYQVTLRNMSADSQRPDLTAVVTLP